MTASAAAYYLYCLTPSGGVEAAAGEPLISHSPGPIVELEIAGLRAVVSLVDDLQAWSDDKQLASLEWITPRALHHERVIERHARLTPVYPARFGTLFTSKAALEAKVRLHADALRAFLDRVSEQTEWDVKLFFDPREAENRWIEEQVRDAATQLEVLPLGRRYLAEQTLRREARASLASHLAALCAQWACDLSYQPDGLCERPLPSISDDRRRPLSHWALLWPVNQTGELRERLDDTARHCEAAGLELECTGPWPPYSFRPNLDSDGL